MCLCQTSPATNTHTHTHTHTLVPRLIAAIARKRPLATNCALDETPPHDKGNSFGDYPYYELETQLNWCERRVGGISCSCSFPFRTSKWSEIIFAEKVHHAIDRSGFLHVVHKPHSTSNLPDGDMRMSSQSAKKTRDSLTVLAKTRTHFRVHARTPLEYHAGYELTPCRTQVSFVHERSIRPQIRKHGTFSQLPN